MLSPSFVTRCPGIQSLYKNYACYLETRSIIFVLCFLQSLFSSFHGSSPVLHQPHSLDARVTVFSKRHGSVGNWWRWGAEDCRQILQRTMILDELILFHPTISGYFGRTMSWADPNGVREMQTKWHFLGCLWPTIPFPPARQRPIIHSMLRHSTLQLGLPCQPYKAPASCPQMAPVVSASRVELKWNLRILSCSGVQGSYFPGDDEKGWQRLIMRTCLSVWAIFQG